MVVRIGLLGASNIAPNAIIAPARVRNDMRITAIAARDIVRARAYAEAHEIPAAMDDYDALVARDDVDLVYCALPPAAHLGPCLAALKAGKALVIEKPLAMNAGEGAVIAAAAKAAGRPAMEAFHYRFHAMFNRALELVREGRLGVILRAYACFDAEIDRSPDALRWDPAQGGGATMDLGCYALHALRTLIAEEPALVAARAVLESGVDAEMSAELAFPGGVTAQVHCSMIKPVSNILVIEGERATLRLDLFVLPQLGGELSLSGAHENLKEVAHGPTSYEAQLAHVAEVMRGEREPLTGGTDAVANMAIIDAMRLAVGMGVG